MRRSDAQMKIRLPAECKAWIEEQAERNGASLNSEIVRAVRDRMDRMSQPAASAATD